MNRIFSFTIVLVVFSTGHGFPSHNRRQAFNPNELMDSYMNMRTDEGTFGSYHPNDLVEAIGRYFKNGGGETNQQNHWGLQLYNPNNAMPQYMGQQQDPGNLAPSMPGAEQTGIKQKDGGQGYQVGFNPDALNNRLMASVKAPSYSSSKTDVTDNTKGSSVHAFNPDNVNKELMMSTQHLQTMNQNPSGAQQGSNSNQHTGYNADQVNAGLYSSLNYNPNAVNSAMFNMPSFGTHGQNSGGAQSTGTHASTSAPGSQSSSGGSTGPGQAGQAGQAGAGQGVATGTGQGGATGIGQGQSGATGTGQGGGTGTGQSGASGNGLGGANGAGQSGAQGIGQSSTTGNGQDGNVGTSQLQQAGANSAGMPQATGIGGMGASSPFSQAGAGTGAPGGPIQPVNRIKQNGLPPGISSGMALSQTQANDPTVDGIGGLGK